jgi:hypothetical protein
MDEEHLQSVHTPLGVPGLISLVPDVQILALVLRVALPVNSDEPRRPALANWRLARRVCGL